MKDKALLKSLVTILVLIAFLSVVYAVGNWIKDSRALKISNHETTILQEVFNNIEIHAQSAFVFDLFNGKVFYSKDENKKLPIASLTKIMTALVVLDKFDKESIIVIPTEALKTTGDDGLKADEGWRVEDLVKFMLLSSSNDAASAFSVRYPGNLVADMNTKANELGFSNTLFFNEHGLDIKEGENSKEYKAGNYSSVKEIAYLISYTVSQYPEIFKITSQKSAKFKTIGGSELEVNNTNDKVDFLPHTLVSKTGFTPRAGGSLATVFEPETGHPVVISVLGSTLEERSFDIIRLAIAVLEYFNSI